MRSLVKYLLLISLSVCLVITIPATVFAWLDRYEGIDPARPLAGEYLRTIDRIELFVDAASVRTVDAWVYVYRGALGRAREIPHGTWES